MGVEVYTVEIIPELAEQAAVGLNEIGYCRRADAERRWLLRLGRPRAL